MVLLHEKKTSAPPVKQERSIGWQTLKDADIKYCSIEEILEHRPELRYQPIN